MGRGPTVLPSPLSAAQAEALVAAYQDEILHRSACVAWVDLLRAWNLICLAGQGVAWKTSGEQWWMALKVEDAQWWLSASGTLQKTQPEKAEPAALPPVQDRLRFRGHCETFGRHGLGIALFCDRPDALDEEALVEALWNYSCHPFLGRKIAADLKTHGQRITTVQAPIAKWFEHITRDLAMLGVRMQPTYSWPGRGIPQVPETESEPAPPRRPALAR